MPKTFVVSSGRSGSAYMAREYGLPHEHEVHTIQPLAIKRYYGRISSEDCARVIEEVYRKIPGDSSNKLAWVIPELRMAFPDARIIHLIRDGRKVCSSYFHKLPDEVYTEAGIERLRKYVWALGPEPLPLKENWWPVRKSSQGWDQFMHICWHWMSSNRAILDALKDDVSHETVRAEDLGSRPHNVNRPVDYMLTPGQTVQFWTVCGDMMRRLGYDGQPEYRMNYG